MKKIKAAFISLAAMLGLSTALLAAPASAINVFDQCGGNADSAVCKAQNDNASTMIRNVVNLLLFVVGVISVIMIVVGGIRYSTSNGDSGAIKSAKDTILYAIVGLVVALLSFAIVNFVLRQF